jgi:hypothetical protein
MTRKPLLLVRFTANYFYTHQQLEHLSLYL